MLGRLKAIKKFWGFTGRIAHNRYLVLLALTVVSLGKPSPQGVWNWFYGKPLGLD
jgi:hypothetical protein